MYSLQYSRCTGTHSIYLFMAVYNNGSDGFFGTLKYNSETKDYDEIHKGRGFDFLGVLRNIESGKIKYKLKTKLQEDIFATEEFSPADLNLQGIGTLAASGFDVNQYNLKTFAEVLQQEYLQFAESGEPFLNTHSCIGWDDFDECGKCFKYQGLVVDKEKYPNFSSVYDGTLDIVLKPDFKEQLLGQVNVIKKYIIDNYAMEAALAVGASAVVNGYISDDIENMNIIVHFFGDSSTGKTTAAQLAISTACRPYLSSNSLMKSWLGTDNSIISRVKGNYGFPVVFDEISKYQGRNLSQLVYSLSDGIQKDRCTKTGETKELTKYDAWRTTIISTGETSLLDRCSQNTGLAARVIELNCKFTRSASEADVIKEAVNKYYGCIAPYLAKFMLTMDKSEILDIHDTFRQKYASQSKAKGLENRIGTNVAVILTAAELLNRCCNLTLDTDKMLSLFLQAEDTGNSTETLADRAYNYLINTITANTHHFVKEAKLPIVGSEIPQLTETPVSNTERWGKIEEEKQKVLIIYEKMKVLLKKGGFESDKVTLRAMREAGYLDHDKGRNTRDRKISKDDATSCTVVILKLPGYMDEIIDDKDKPIFVADKYVEQTRIDDYVDIPAGEADNPFTEQAGKN